MAVHTAMCNVTEAQWLLSHLLCTARDRIKQSLLQKREKFSYIFIAAACAMCF